MDCDLFNDFNEIDRGVGGWQAISAALPIIDVLCLSRVTLPYPARLLWKIPVAGFENSAGALLGMLKSITTLRMHIDLFNAIISLAPLPQQTKANLRRAAMKAAGGAAYEARLDYERAARARYREKHPEYWKRPGRGSHRMEVSFKAYLCSKARKRGRKRGMEATITPADLVWPSHCPVLGLELDYPERPGVRAGMGYRANAPSLDRWDNSKGYVPGNVFVVSMRANTLKNSATYDEILKVAKYLSRRPR